jgi:lipopolysaccharide export LptBFGC system permease protein LptF
MLSILKNPIILAIIVSALVFTVMYYWYPLLNKDSKKKRSDKRSDKSSDKSSDKKKIDNNINETIVISTAIAGLATWFIASSVFSDKQDVDNSDGIINSVSSVSSESTKQMPVLQHQQGGTGASGGAGGNGVSSTQTQIKIPHISSDDPTRSYNLIGSGLNIPRSELNIPKVLIDYK